MGKLIYSGIMSLDGYVNDAEGNFAWSAPEGEVHEHVNAMSRGIGTFLLGRRMYEVLRFWETAHEEPGMGEEHLDFAGIWRAADKIVYSTTLSEAPTARTEVRRQFDVDEVKRLKATATGDISVSGPALAEQAIAAGLVDEYLLYLNPISVGGGTPYLPVGHRVRLALLDQHRFANGVLFARYGSARRSRVG